MISTFRVLPLTYKMQLMLARVCVWKANGQAYVVIVYFSDTMLVSYQVAEIRKYIMFDLVGLILNVVSQSNSSNIVARSTKGVSCGFARPVCRAY